MDLASLIGAPVEGALPPEIAPIVQAVIEGRIAQIALVAETTDGNILSAFPTLDDSKVNRFALIGALDVLKRDYMREHIAARIEYEPRDDS